MFKIGTQRVGIVSDIPVLDGGGQPVVSEFMEPEMTETVAWVDGCAIEIPVRKIGEQQGLTVTSSEFAWVFMPSTEGRVPLVDVNGNPAGSVIFTDITGDKRLREYATGRDYVMRGDAVHNVGKVPHVFCECERQQG